MHRQALLVYQKHFFDILAFVFIYSLASGDLIIKHHIWLLDTHGLAFDLHLFFNCGVFVSKTLLRLVETYCPFLSYGLMVLLVGEK